MSNEEWNEFCDTLGEPTLAEQRQEAYQRTCQVAPDPAVQELEELAHQSLGLPAPLPFEIDTPMRLNWGIGKVLGFDQQVANLDAFAAWARDEKKRLKASKQHFLDRFGPQMEAVQRSMQTRGSKTVGLPNGKAAMRMSREGIEITNELQCFAWCTENLKSAHKCEITLSIDGSQEAFASALDSLCTEYGVEMRSKSSLSKTALNEFFEKEGYAPDGCEYKASVEGLIITPHKTAIEQSENE